MEKKIQEALYAAAGEKCVRQNEWMKKHTTFRIGGPADWFVVPDTKEKLMAVVAACRELRVPYYILGNGSNLLVGDGGYRGVVIQLFKNYSDIIIEGTVVKAQAGALLSRIASRARDAGLAGFAFASGIPGTIGGAAVMNAGAYGEELKDVLLEAEVLDGEGRILHLSREELEMGYRTSVIARRGYLVLSCTLGLIPGDREEITAYMEELRTRRVTKQPVDMPSAGSTFKRPEGYFAGKLIMDAGLRGYTVGDAQVSEKHCGFVINRGEATAKDVRTLMDDVVRRVKEQFGVVLEPEVKMLGEFLP